MNKLAIGLLIGILGWGDGWAEDMQLGYATYYTEASCKREGTSGVWTASGERYDEGGLTCAVRSRAWGGLYRVVNTRTGAEVIVRNNDYGPGRGPSSKGVVIDLTPRAFMAIDPKMTGRVEVFVERLTN